jgi:2-polyprenyl-3-methyl-5-hydroxy-6-metoxy-1,4-benzoquinol methylase
LLDVGAHAGRFIALARRAGWDAEGIELNPQTAAYARAASGAPVHQVNVHEFDPGGRPYDAITITDVLEHVPQPAPVLSRVRQLLAPGGCVAVKVPNGPAQRFKENARALLHRGYRPTLADNLVHVNHFSTRSLRLALERAGFRSVTVEAGAPELPDSSAASRFVRLGSWHLARVPGGVHTPLAFNLQAYGRAD